MPSKKLLPLQILHILREYSDEAHALTQAQIQQHLYHHFNAECERKAVSRNIGLLREFGYDIAHGETGYSLLGREFDATQTRLLMDAVLTSSYLTARDTRELLEHLGREQSVYFRQKHNLARWVEVFPHTNRGQVFYTLAVIMDAIDAGQKIAFHYSHYGSDKKLHLTRPEKYTKAPYNILLKKGEYYLLCDITDEDGVDNFRLEFISEIEIIDEAAKRPELDLQAYYNEHIYMMSGRSVDVRLKVESWIIEQMFDWLGFDIRVERLDERYSIIHTRANLEALVFFSMQYMLFVEVLHPPEVRELLHSFCAFGAGKYAGEPGSYNGEAHTQINRRMRELM